MFWSGQKKTPERQAPPNQNIARPQSRVFISYARHDLRRADRPGVEHYISVLSQLGLDIAFDGTLLGGSLDWEASLRDAIVGSDCLIYFASAASWASENCRKEVEIAHAAKKTCLPFFLEPAQHMYGGSLNPYISHAFAAIQRTDLCGFDGDDWVFPAALSLSNVGIRGLETYAQDPRARRAPIPYDGLGAWHLGVMTGWDRQVLLDAIAKCRRRLEFGANQADVDMGLALCLLALRRDKDEARRRLDSARAYFTDVAQTHFYAALSMCAYDPLSQLSKKDYLAAQDRLDEALSIVPDYRAALFLKAALQSEYAAANRLRETGPLNSRELLAEAMRAPTDPWEMYGLSRILLLRDQALAAALHELT